MSLLCKIIQPEDIDSLLQLEELKLTESYLNEEERLFASWNSRARKESLEHYAKLGWSFKVLNQEEKLVGFILAQPLLFFAGHTQSLWVEHLCSFSVKAHEFLIDVIYRLAREKHLQGVYFSKAEFLENVKVAFKSELWGEAPSFVPTVRR